MSGTGRINTTTVRSLLRFATYEARVAREALAQQWRRYKTLRLIEGHGDYHIHPTTVFDPDATASIVLGHRVLISRFVYLAIIDGGTLDIGDDAYIGEFSNIRANGGNVCIGARTIIAQHVTIVASNHAIPPRPKPIKYAGDEEGCRGVTIERDAWIAANVVVLPGVHIGEGAVVGAGSVVTKSIPPYAIAVGSPARVLRYR